MSEVSDKITADDLEDENNGNTIETTSEHSNSGTKESEHFSDSNEKIPVKSIGKTESVIDNEESMEDIPVDQDNKVYSVDTKTNGTPTNTVTNKSPDISVKVQTFKDWGYNTFMRTKQKVKEKLSRTSRTIDTDLEDKIDIIKLQQTQYRMMLNNNNRMIEQLRQNVLIHQYSSRMFAELAQTDKVLSETFISQSQSELVAAGHFKDLIDKMLFSNTTLETLVTKTFDDMLFGIQAFEVSRVEYDAFKTETVKLVTQTQQKNSSNPNDLVKLQEMQERLEQKREKYESNKSSVLVKLELLDDNKTRVIQREILNFRHAWFCLHSSCLELYSGNKPFLVTESTDDLGTEKDKSAEKP